MARGSQRKGVWKRGKHVQLNCFQFGDFDAEHFFWGVRYEWRFWHVLQARTSRSYQEDHLCLY